MRLEAVEVLRGEGFVEGWGGGEGGADGAWLRLVCHCLYLGLGDCRFLLLRGDLTIE